ncbi:MAG: hypothetical protein F4X11_14450 [Acidobacteria bacterium]|nr:hypothetical protein [Acidobacteriota bacterium]
MPGPGVEMEETLRCSARIDGKKRRDGRQVRLRRARRWPGAVFAILALVGLLGGVTASAQEPAAESRLTVERIRSGFIVAPDLKLTSIDGGSGALAGLYGGFITDRRLLVGAGAYWLTGESAGVDMAYGGGLVEWFANPGGRVDFSLRSLFGFGRATLSSTFEIPIFHPLHGHAARLSYSGPRHGRHRGGWSPKGHRAWNDNFEWPSSFTYRYREDFLIADPQLSVHLNVTDWLRIGGGAGYRFVGRAGAEGDRLRGFTASAGLQLGPP